MLVSTVSKDRDSEARQNGHVPDVAFASHFMSSSPAYQPIPSGESVNNIVKQRPRSYTRKASFLVLAFCFVALFSFKAGQWWVPKGNRLSDSPTANQDTSSNSEENNNLTVPEQHVNSTDMPGKYSVG
jgi:hypothetical protein